ncbi:hypothetical protein [Terrabacter sp. NPDC080008]|uniref:hypothetical protein n=1 Tax=Terrabacter sp. NPDC080008 TaxID=3155176 RepID=UPI00344C212F
MLVDCQTCPVRDVHCADCMVTALTAIPMRPGASASGPDPHEGDRFDTRTVPLDRAERRAVSAFLAAGLVTTAVANAARAEVTSAGHAAGHATRRAV